MRSIYLAQNLPEAELLRQRLLEEGVETYVRNAQLQGALGELPLTCNPDLCVLNDVDYDVARQLLAKYKSEEQQADGAERACSACGEKSPANFELCWSCREPL